MKFSRPNFKGFLKSLSERKGWFRVYEVGFVTVDEIQSY